jgi:putative hydrolase of the HAD superfamily
MSIRDSRYKGLLLDFGGVITSDFFGSIDDYCQRLGLPRGRFREVVTTNPTGRALYHQIERGEISQSTFEHGLAALLCIPAEGLITGLLAGLRPNEQIIEAAARARASGVRVGVFSNSWGTEPYDPYAGYYLHKHYDAVILSGEVGLRKPDPAIYLLAVDKLGLPATACVLVDDVAANLPPAAEVGMATIHHTDNSASIHALEGVLGLPSEGLLDLP